MQVAPGIIEKFYKPKSVISNQIVKILKESKIKYPKKVEALDRILYLIRKRGISYQGTQELAANNGTL